MVVVVVARALAVVEQAPGFALAVHFAEQAAAVLDYSVVVAAASGVEVAVVVVGVVVPVVAVVV